MWSGLLEGRAISAMPETPASCFDPWQERGRAVEPDGAQMRERADQSGEIVADQVSDRGVAAAVAAGAGDDVPQADMRREQRGEAGVIIERDEIAADHARHQAPELVLRVRIIAPLGEGAVSGQTAQHKQPDIGIDHRGKERFSITTPVALPCAGRLSMAAPAMGDRRRVGEMLHGGKSGERMPWCGPG